MNCLTFKKKKVFFHLQKMRSSSIFKKNEVDEVFFHISSSLVKIKLHTKNQVSWLPGSAVNVIILGVVWRCSGFLTDSNTTPGDLG